MSPVLPRVERRSVVSDKNETKEMEIKVVHERKDETSDADGDHGFSHDEDKRKRSLIAIVHSQPSQHHHHPDEDSEDEDEQPQLETPQVLLRSDIKHESRMEIEKRLGTAAVGREKKLERKKTALVTLDKEG